MDINGADFLYEVLEMHAGIIFAAPLLMSCSSKTDAAGTINEVCWKLVQLRTSFIFLKF
jgi:hypothetical protein